MAPLNRRDLLRAGLALSGAAVTSSLSRRALSAACDAQRPAGPPVEVAEVAGPGLGKARDRFLAWLFADGIARDHGVRNLVFNFYDVPASRGVWVYPMLTGKTMLWLARQGRVEDASTMARTLLRWQQVDQDGALARSYGAFPSKIDRAAARPTEWVAADFYYSGDNLVILEALVAVYERTKAPELLNAAIGIGTWLTETMCNGKAHGMWVDDHAAPMFMVRGNGAFVNEIHTSEEMLWIGALHRLGKAAAEEAYCRQAERAFAFLRGSQGQSGAYFDKYDPGYPAQPYSAGRWNPYQAGQLIGDNLLRCALGSCRMGELARARRFYDWLKVEQGAVPAFIDAMTGGSGFPAGQPVYYDLSSSALHRSLSQWLGERTKAAEAAAYLARTQQPNGAWYWGALQGSGKPVTPELAPVVGLWATADLSSRIE